MTDEALFAQAGAVMDRFLKKALEENAVSVLDPIVGDIHTTLNLIVFRLRGKPWRTASDRISKLSIET